MDVDVDASNVEDVEQVERSENENNVFTTLTPP